MPERNHKTKIAGGVLRSSRCTLTRPGAAQFRKRHQGKCHNTRHPPVTLSPRLLPSSHRSSNVYIVPPEKKTPLILSIWSIYTIYPNYTRFTKEIHESSNETSLYRAPSGYSYRGKSRPGLTSIFSKCNAKGLIPSYSAPHLWGLTILPLANDTQTHCCALNPLRILVVIRHGT